MFVGILQFELLVPDSTSLKDKRRVVRSLKDRLHAAHQVSVAEIGALDHRSIAAMGLALVAGTPRRVTEVLDAITNKLHTLQDAQVQRIHRDIIKLDALPDYAIDPEAASLPSLAPQEAASPFRNDPFTHDDRREAESLLRSDAP